MLIGNQTTQRFLLTLHKIRLETSIKRLKSTTAGILVIGDEILKGATQDTNSCFLAKQLHNRGYKLEAIAVVPDDVTAISKTLKKWSKMYGVVLTTGGIGPTHDDVTYEALADAFNRQLYHNPEIVKMCKKFFKTDDILHPSMKLARIPVGATLNFGTNPKTGERAVYPNVSVENIYVFPGVPHLCRKMFEFSSDFFPIIGKFFTTSLYFTTNENELVVELNNAVKKFPAVKFGSYPEFFNSQFSVRIDLESLNQLALNQAEEYLKNNINGFTNYDAEK